jgi:protein gp37
VGQYTAIEWTEASWNPVTGCTKVSPGCAYCYAERITVRRGGQRFLPGHALVRLHPDRLLYPLRWKRPRMIFACSMSDLFHEDVPFSFIAEVLNVMKLAARHVFQVLTKRPDRMSEFVESWEEPPANVWVGVSAENQRWAETRIPSLLRVPASVHFVSCEPLLGPVDLSEWLRPGGLDWVIAGGESSGPPARRLVQPCSNCSRNGRKRVCSRCHGTGWEPKSESLVWVRELCDQCLRADVPLFFKQWGGPRPTSAGRLLDGRFREAWPSPIGPARSRVVLRRNQPLIIGH